MYIFKWLVWVCTGCKMHVGAISAATIGAIGSVGASIAQGSAAGKGIKGPSKEALFAGIAEQQKALMGAQQWATKSQAEQQAIIEDYYNRAVASQAPYLGLGETGVNAINDYIFGSPARENRAESGTNPAEAARITSEWNDVNARFNASQQAVTDTKAALDKAAAGGWQTNTQAGIIAAQQAYVKAQQDAQAISAEHQAKQQQFNAIQPYISAQTARDAIPAYGSETFQTTTQAGVNGRAAPTFNPYKEYTPLTEEEMIKNDPGYAFRLAQGEGAIQNSALAKGGFFSGGTAKAMQEYGQNFASDEFSRANDRNIQNYNIGYEKNNNDFLNQENSWLNEYNAFVSNQNNQYDRIMGLVRVGEDAAGRVGNYSQDTGSNIATTVGNKYNALTNSQNSFANNVQDALLNRDARANEASADKGFIKANTIGAVGENLATGALLGYGAYRNSQPSGGTSGGINTSNNSIQNAFNSSLPNYKWGA